MKLICNHRGIKLFVKHYFIAVTRISEVPSSLFLCNVHTNIQLDNILKRKTLPIAMVDTANEITILTVLTKVGASEYNAAICVLVSLDTRTIGEFPVGRNHQHPCGLLNDYCTSLVESDD